ncbi:hypothetical protein TPA0910_71740 [Streptomyces hygroscopicus subsp. sporocinereus]|uniref:Uncharacterized protein n=1 Tax=Streptomyces hygroscopicus TaxID=1912 RepID=A0ABQ3UAV4_STRHY|nr:hypothetical protein TPA0910_71740 [Streptomyces hygroscopicus]
MSRQGLRTLTGLSSGSVSDVVGALLADGLLADGLAEKAGSVGSDGFIGSDGTGLGPDAVALGAAPLPLVRFLAAGGVC